MPRGGTVYTVEELDNHEGEERKQSLPPLQQRLLLFLLLQHSDPFTVQLCEVVGWWQLYAITTEGFVYVAFFDLCSNMWAATEMLMERHLEDILNNNRQAVIGACHTAIKDTLKTQIRRKKASKVSCWKEIPICHFMLTVFIRKIYSFTEIAVLVINIVRTRNLHYIDSVIFSILCWFVWIVNAPVYCGRIKRSCFLPLRSSSVLLSVLWVAAVISSSEMPVWTAWRYEKNAYWLLYCRQIIIKEMVLRWAGGKVRWMEEEDLLWVKKSQLWIMKIWDQHKGIWILPLLSFRKFDMK